MIFRKRKKHPQPFEETREQWLKSYPMQACDWFQESDGRTVLLMPRTRNRLMKKVLSLISRDAPVKIHLDERGTFIWNLCDGEHTIGQICQALKEKFGEKVEPVEERTILFMITMYKHQFIQLYEKMGAATNPATKPENLESP